MSGRVGLGRLGEGIRNSKRLCIYQNPPTVHTKMYHVSEQGGLFVS